jgi:hypothetical protein
MSRVLSGKKSNPGRDTDRVGRVEIRETQPFFGHFIYVRCLDEFLSIAAQAGITEVIGVDEDNVWFFPDASAAAQQAQAGQQQYRTHRDDAGPHRS